MVIHEQMHMLCILPLMQTPYYKKTTHFSQQNYVHAHSIQIYMF